MKTVISTFLKHPLISGSSIIFIGSFISNILAYVFNLSMIRLLSVADYGLLTTLTSLTVLFGIFQISLIGIFAKFSSKYSSSNNRIGLDRLTQSGIKLVSIIAFMLFGVLILLTPFFAHLLHISHSILLIIVFFSIALSIVTSLPFGILQGKMKFWSVSILYVLSPVIKLTLGVIMVWMGYSLIGVLCAIAIAALIPAIIGYILIHTNDENKSKNIFNYDTFFHEFKKYSIYFFLASLGITIITNADIMLIRTFFSEEVSGLYAALSLMGKAIFYFTSPIYFVFFPLIAHRNEKKQPYGKELLMGILLVACITGSITLFYYLFPSIVLRIFAPREEYKVLIPYMGQFALYITIFSIANIFNHLFLSLNKVKVALINLFTAGFFIVMVISFHDSLQQIINTLFISASMLLILYVLYYYHLTNGKN